jgi:hypothetical protein
MKHILLILLLATGAFAQTPAPAPTTASPSAAPAQDESTRKALTWINKMIAALGGSAYLNIQDISQEGRTYGFSHGESSAGAPFWRFYKWPDKERLELTKQRDWIIIHNGDKGYEQTFRGTSLEEPEPLQAYLDRTHYSLDHVLRIWLHEPGVLIFDDGPAIAERRQAEKITLMNTKNEAVSIFVDIMTFLPVKRSYQKRNKTYKDIDTEEETYDNWHEVQGIQTPYDVSRIHNGEPQNQRFINKVTYNSGLADSLFEPKGPVKQTK